MRSRSATCCVSDSTFDASSTSRTNIDILVRRVREGSSAWAKLPLPERIRLLGDLRDAYVAIAE
ncbi:hypothetical protein D7V77_26200, partial [Corallococcus sp. CA041A]